MIELLEHNKETYKKLCEVLSDNNKCALVQATGTGKSYIAGKYIEEHAGKALILVPTNAISDAWDELLAGMDEKFDIVTYQAFAKKPRNYFDYDLVIADEMHHLGSDVWGKKFVDTYLQNENHKIIGLTATEIRYLDNSRDMAEEIFENIRVDGCDLPTAINTGVLPTFKYVSALYCDESDFDEWKENAGKIKDVKIQEELKGRLDVCIKNMVSVKQAINENLTDDYRKIIVFLNNVESKETALEMFKDVFPEANFYDVDYSKQRKANNEQIRRFKADENRAVLFAVDMLNEGVHINGTDCVIMFRKTVSPQIYLQQLGRGLASGAGKMPVIFDFVSNVNNIKYSVGEGERRDIINTWNDKIATEKKVICKSYVAEIKNVIGNISCLYDCQWTAWEDEFLIENYKNMGTEEIGEKLNRTCESIYTRCYKLGIAKKDKLIVDDIRKIQNIESKTLKEIKTILNTSLDIYTISKFLKNNGIKFRHGKADVMLTEEEKQYILKSYGNKGISEIAKEIKRGKNTIERFLKKEEVFINTKSITEYKINLIHEMVENNKTYKEITERTGLCRQSIDRVVKTHEFKYPQKSKQAKRAVVQLDLELNYIEKFESIQEANRKIGKKGIGGCVIGKKRTCGGYKWMYEEDYKKMLEEQKAGD